ncbi:hypothetical protein [Tropicimonas sp. IMCC34043]|uniref:hypothetical protein n=1 Tax=Tropicimonas sp. IMCC34043 TaxID=2248760 RepID=UPI0018E4E66A|nr:hypothetical protein [Tropicimonas sp. IMCC34043]
MSLIADFLLIAAALSAALYCLVLSRRLRSFTNLESGMGSAVAVLSVQVDELTKALEGARQTSQKSAESLEQRTQRAEAAAARLELLLASMHDIEIEARNGSNGAARSVRRRRRTGTAALPEEA